MSENRSSHSQPVARAYIDGALRDSDDMSPVIDPFRGSKVGDVARSSLDDLGDALAAARRARDEAAAMPGYRRAALLRRVAGLLEERVPAIAELMSREIGKAIKDSRAELSRSVDTINLSAEEAIRIEGEHVPLDGSEMGAGKLAMMLRFPVGVVAAITPFNAPFNLTIHKLAPALASGNTLVLKAPPQASLVVAEAVRLFADAGVPKGFVNAVYGGAELGQALITDDRVDFITFTGSAPAGFAIKANSGFKRVALELGGNSPTIVHSDADIATAAKTCAINANRLAGQSCISVQNVYVHRSVYEPFVATLVEHVRALKVGDPLDPETEVGTLIDEAAAQRVEGWVQEALNAGARILVGGQRAGAQYAPTVLVDVRPNMKVVCEEIFGPVLAVAPYDDIETVVDAVNNSRYGLQCGVFTQSNDLTFKLIRSLRTGGIIVNGSSTFRTDQMAYGGIRASGAGKEGPKFAIRDMTDERLVVFNL